jgi:hypothetical protein
VESKVTGARVKTVKAEDRTYYVPAAPREVKVKQDREGL